ncbi:hypothetical protein RvY_14789 [Ramazzottius varieornatus]|uniref:HAT C-terminal dimerisation domain-containing protein n=1 Tax=Ramazzottius varieornatus TaxID=947166 RepID=A0A1D1VSM9_RAMVA|nr:hypothetical protein RvY_14789 [Ramazzottius varieornatus]
MNNVAEVGIEDDFRLVSRVREMVKFIRSRKQRNSTSHCESRKKTETRKDISGYPWMSPQNGIALCQYGVLLRRGTTWKSFAATYRTTTFKKNLLKDSEWDDVSRLIRFLSPLEEAINDCSASKSPTFHLGKQCLAILHDHFKAVQDDPSEEPYIKKTAENMETKLTSVELDSWQQEVEIVALLLDPCVKTNAFASPRKKLQATEVLKKYVGLYSDQNIGIPENVTVSQLKPTSLRDSFLRKITNGSTAQQNKVDSYLVSSAEPKCDVLKWWKSRRNVFPVLSKMAIDFMAVCASSVPSE